MAALATAAQLAARIKGGIPDTDIARAEAVLEDISALAEDEAGQDWDATTSPPPAGAVAIILAAARRQFLNPDQYVSEQEGDYMYRLPESLSTDVFTDDELARLRRYRGGSSGLWSLSISGSPDVHDRRYVPDDKGEPILYFADSWSDWL